MRISYKDNAINWVWYGQIDIDVEAGTAEFVEGSQYRLHKFDDHQGANDHPDPDWRLDGVYNGGGGPHAGYEALALTHADGTRHVLSILSRPIWARKLEWAFNELQWVFRLILEGHDSCNYNGVEYDLTQFRNSTNVKA